MYAFSLGVASPKLVNRRPKECLDKTVFNILIYSVMVISTPFINKTNNGIIQTNMGRSNEITGDDKL